MLELKIACEDAEQARVYLNAPQYHNLITDFAQALRNNQKHGTSESLQSIVNTFYEDFQTCAHSLEGPY